MIQLEERTDVTPLCPHCESPQEKIYYQSLPTRLGRRYIYFCKSCKKTLGVSHRKGFWMG
ncbi:MAG: hypothetical protein K8J08_21925 [Thermoanaerobaculia bacterium]|nr:hypothetical protein [Thermoanaerobaculia bacterium]